MSTYSSSHKSYYERNKRLIMEKQKISGKGARDLEYYHKNKRKINLQRKARHLKKLREQYYEIIQEASKDEKSAKPYSRKP